MGNDFFRFKQFIVRQGETAMKVGVDSVLLGAWTNPDKTTRILDVGAGTGLLALMLAQRFSDAVIDAVEIEREAYHQALENVDGSPWNRRIRVICDDFLNYTTYCSSHYDLIISNPPYFTASLKSLDTKRNVARHNDSLPPRSLLDGSAKLLSTDGILAVVLPPAEASLLMNEVTSYGLFVKRILHVQSLPSKPVCRMLLELSKTKCLPEEIYLCIEKLDRSDYTDEYKQLTKEFYLKF